MNCIPVIRVPRSTVFLAPVMSVLKISCTITLPGCHRSPSVSWCKLYGDVCKSLNYSDHIRTEWKSITEHEGMAFLIFLNISMEDTGLYRCREGDTSISHAINVTVTGKRLSLDSLMTVNIKTHILLNLNNDITMIFSYNCNR